MSNWHRNVVRALGAFIARYPDAGRARSLMQASPKKNGNLKEILKKYPSTGCLKSIHDLRPGSWVARTIAGPLGSLSVFKNVLYLNSGVRADVF